MILREYLATGRASTGIVGGATSELIEAADIVEFAVDWMAEHSRHAVVVRGLPGCRLLAISYQWRAEFSNDEVNRLHAEAFETRVFDESEWNWRDLVSAHSLGWVVARDGTALVGFVNVLWDGLVHAWIQDTMVATDARGLGVGTRARRGRDRGRP